MKQIQLYLIAAAVFCIAAVFSSQPRLAIAQQPKGMQWALDQMDDDNDGAISRSEAKWRTSCRA